MIQYNRLHALEMDLNLAKTKIDISLIEIYTDIVQCQKISPHDTYICMGNKNERQIIIIIIKIEHKLNSCLTKKSFFFLSLSFFSHYFQITIFISMQIFVMFKIKLNLPFFKKIRDNLILAGI